MNPLDKKVQDIERGENISFIENIRRRLNEFVGVIRNDSFWKNKGDLVVGKSTRDAGTLLVGDDGHVLTADSTEALGVKWAAASGGGWTTVVKTANYTAATNEEVLCDTATTGAFTVTLPASPNNGDRVRIIDSASNFGTANLTVGRNSQTIRGAASDLVIATDNLNYEFVYNGTDSDWEYAVVGGTVGVAGADTQIQYNNGGSMGAIDAFRWDETNHKLLYEARSNVARYFKIEGVIEPITGNNTLLWFSQPYNAAGNAAGFQFDGGDAEASGKFGGTFDFYGGYGPAGGGGFSSYGGNSSDGNGGWNSLVGGNGGVDGGWVYLQAGEGIDDGGVVWLQAGNSTGTSAGNAAGYIWLQSGDADAATEDGGYIYVIPGEGGASARYGLLWYQWGSTVKEVIGGGTSTTDATPTDVPNAYIDTGTGTKHTIEVEITATSGNNMASYKYIGSFKNVSGTVSQVGSTTVVHSAEDVSGWDAGFNISGTRVYVQVTGAAATSITWKVIMNNLR